MKKNEVGLKVLLLSQPLQHTEWLSLMGDKYYSALPFAIEFTHELSAAEIIVWDGVMTPKSQKVYQDVVHSLREGKVLLLQGEARTLLKKHPIVSQVNIEEMKCVDLPGWSILPEEMIVALEKCHQKLKNV